MGKQADRRTVMIALVVSLWDCGLFQLTKQWQLSEAGKGRVWIVRVCVGGLTWQRCIYYSLCEECICVLGHWWRPGVRFLEAACCDLGENHWSKTVSHTLLVILYSDKHLASFCVIV